MRSQSARRDFARFALLALVAQIPFESRYTLLGLTNLQWTFVILVLLSAPDIFREWKQIASNRLIQVTTGFVAIQWLAAFLAPEFHTNAFKAAVRFTAALFILVIHRSSGRTEISQTWTIASAAAAIYALAAYAGLGLPSLFRTEEFYLGQIQRLSGSFEYPNTAAAYFAMSLPIVWWSSFRPALRATFVFLMWCAVVLTFSKGALLAVPAVLLIARPKAALPLLAIGAAAYAALLPLNPYLIERIYGPGVRNPIAVEYRAPWNKLEQQPHTNDSVPLQIRNTGVTTIRSRGWWRAAVAYRWWNTETESFVALLPITTVLPHDIERGETMEVAAAFQTPDQPGRYLLVFELFSRNFDWFSQTGVVPALIQADIQSSSARAVYQTDLSSLYKRGRNPAFLTAAVSRGSLWTAALRMFADHPFGAGPDNYRLQYGKYLGATRWDTHIYSNNLYLELLAGSGILGLAAFGLVLASRPWHADASSLAAGVFLVHGLVDVFLMTTPIYFAFWILMGEIRGRLPKSPN